MNTTDPTEAAPTATDPSLNPTSKTKLSTRQRWLVAGASFGAFWISATPIGLLLYLAQAEDVNAPIIAAAASLAGGMFAFTAGLILYLILKT